jgi:hypothetical protein
MRSIALRLAECGLTMHPEKSKIVYCKDSNRTAVLSACSLHIPWLYVSAKEGHQQSKPEIHRLHAGCEC